MSHPSLDRHTRGFGGSVRPRKPTLSPLPPPAHLALGAGATHPGLLAAPFVKWVGSKRWLVRDHAALLPVARPGGRVAIPFVGAGSVAFHYAATGAALHLSDANPHLVNLFEAVRDDVESVIKDCASLAEIGYDAAHYGRIRDFINGGRGPSSTRAAAFLAINKWGFNGLWRVNSKGACNVPFGKPSKAGSIPVLCDPAILSACSAALRGATIERADFRQHVPRLSLGKGDVAYFDPPYVPASATSSFTGYTSDGFGAKDQEGLVGLLGDIDRAGVRWAASNSDTPVTRALYARAGWNITTLSRSGSVSCKGTGRAKVGEILVSNGAAHPVARVPAGYGGGR